MSISPNLAETPSPSLPETTGSEAKPSDWVLVPREPTEAILDAFWHQAGESKEMRSRVHVRARHYWRAMIDAASPLPTGTDYAGPIERLRVVAEALSNNGYESHPITQAAQALCTAQQERDTLQQKNKELEEKLRLKRKHFDVARGNAVAAEASLTASQAECERRGTALEDVSDRLRMLGYRIEKDTSRPTKRHVRMWATELHGISEAARAALSSKAGETE